MEEFTVLQMMFNMLNSDNPNKKAVIETLPTLLNMYSVHRNNDVYELVLNATRNICFQVFDCQFDNSIWNDSNVSLDNLKFLLVNFIDIITSYDDTAVVQLFKQFVESTNKINFNNFPIENLRYIEFCVQQFVLTCGGIHDDCARLDRLRLTLLSVLNEPHSNKHKVGAIMAILNDIVSVDCVPALWNNMKSMIAAYPDRTINLLFNAQYVFFDPLCVDVILTDEDFWNLLCSLLTHENNVVRTYVHVVLKLACSSQLLKEKIHFYVALNDYVVVMETLENTQQHLTLPILNTTKKLASHKAGSDYNDYKLPLKWISAMCSKMSKHSSRYVVLASIDIVTNMPTKLLKEDEQIIKSFVNSLNNIFLYKMNSELCVDRPDLELVLTSWLDELMESDDGHDIFNVFLSYVPTVKWTVVPLFILTKSLFNISSNPPLGFNVVSYVAKIISAIDEMPNSYLKTAVLLFLFDFTGKFFVNNDTEICCDLFDCIIVCCKNTDSLNYVVKSIGKINNLDCFHTQLLQRLSKKQKIHSTCLGLLFLSNISADYTSSMEKLNDMCSNAIDAVDQIEFLECLLKVENDYGHCNTYLNQILDKHIWTQTTFWVEKCLYTIEKNSCENPVVRSFLCKVLHSKRIINTADIMNIWLDKCASVLVDRLGNHDILAIYSWIGKYATMYSTDDTLKNDWLSFTKRFILLGFFSLKNLGFYQLKKPGMHVIPQLDIIDTFFQYSTVPEDRIVDVFDWFTRKTLERHDEHWTIYFSTLKTFLCKFPVQTYPKKVILFVKNCWEFLVGCRVSCFPNSTKSFIEMVFHRNLLSEKLYVKFVENEIIQKLLIEQNCRDKFSVCFSLLLHRYFKESNVMSFFESSLIMSKFFAKCTLFSIDRFGASKIEWDTLEYIRTLDNFSLINDISTKCLPDDKCLRFSAIEYLYEYNSEVLWTNVLNDIVKIESSLRDRKYFHNSKAYRIKQRAVQVLLIIACDTRHKSKILDENIYKWSLMSLKEVSHIHSVAYQLIWLLVLIYNESTAFCDFWSDFRNAQENHNYLCSFISILYHLKKIKNNDELFELEAKKHLLPLCFSNGYKIRLFSQVTICRVFPCDSVESEWSFLCKTIENVTANNEQTKKYENPFNDFFYKELDTINYLSLKNVCVELPRLLNIVYEERFPSKWINNLSANKTCNDKYDLSQCSVSSFIEKNTASVLSNETIETAQNAQRKYIPSQPQDERTTNSSLIVVASLIDKVTNLGGLTRTCQVFGVSTLVVDSLSCVEKKEFMALSMTAEKHQCIIEVREKNLKSYLLKKKDEGYQIVAAEQTVNSVKLHDFQLPFKCVLLLGNETSGIPHGLLSVMDTCIEIEQLGIVRSLNVHVAGSLFIWEYTKQHCFKVSS